MKNIQSSIEWYANASHELIVKKDNGEITNREFLTMHHNLFYDAEAMHKEDVISFAKKCLDKVLDLDVRTAHSQVEEMYTETFGGNNETH